MVSILFALRHVTHNDRGMHQSIHSNYLTITYTTTIIIIILASMPSSPSLTSRLAYTFLFIRMARNPLSYGINHEDLYADPQLEQKRLQLITEAAATLDACMMVRFDKRSGNLAVTNQGTIILVLVLLTEHGHS